MDMTVLSSTGFRAHTNRKTNSRCTKNTTFLCLALKATDNDLQFVRKHSIKRLIRNQTTNPCLGPRTSQSIDFRFGISVPQLVLCRDGWH